MNLIAESTIFSIATVSSAGGALVTVLAMAVIAYIQRSNKALSCSMTTDCLISIEESEDHEGKLRVLYEDMDIRNLYRVQVRLSNTGNQPIHPDDFIVPITVGFATPARILTASVTSQRPASMGAAILRSSRDIKIPALLLNPKDSFSISALIGDLDVEPSISGRIVGVKEIRRKPERTGMWIMATAIVATILAIIGGVRTLLDPTPLAFVFSYVGMALMVVAVIARSLEQRRERDVDR